MGTATVITSSTLTQLEADVTELTTKLNGVITQYNLVQADMTTNRAAIDSLKTKYNNAKSDITELRSKVVTATSLVNNLRTDLLEVQDLITKDQNSGTYSEPASPSDRGILAKLKRLEDQCSYILDYGLSYNNTDGFLHTVLATNPATASVSSDTNSSELSTTSTSALTNPAAQTSTTVTDTTADQSGSTASASVTPSYTTGAEKVITIGAKGEVRAKRLARQTLNRLRK